MGTESDRAALLAAETADAYSAHRYRSWRAVCAALLARYTYKQAEEILRSKFTRWAADASAAGEGKATVADLLNLLDTCTGATRAELDRILS